MRGLTPKDIEVLNYIKDFMKINAMIPTVREIGEGTNLYSTSTVQKHIKRLEEAGELIREEGGKRYRVKGIEYREVDDGV